MCIEDDYAGCFVSRKSMSRNIILGDKHFIKCSSTTQTVILKSSYEAEELYTAVKGVSVSISLYIKLGKPLVIPGGPEFQWFSQSQGLNKGTEG